MIVNTGCEKTQVTVDILRHILTWNHYKKLLWDLIYFAVGLGTVHSWGLRFISQLHILQWQDVHSAPSRKTMDIHLWSPFFMRSSLMTSRIWLKVSMYNLIWTWPDMDWLFDMHWLPFFHLGVCACACGFYASRAASTTIDQWATAYCTSFTSLQPTCTGMYEHIIPGSCMSVASEFQLNSQPEIANLR